MKLYIKQKIFSWNDKFSVYDANGEERYWVEGELFSWGKKLHVYDNSQREAAFIRQEVLTFLPKFIVSINGQDIAEIVKEFTFFKPRYRIDGLGWEIDGDFWDHDYEIMKNGHTIVSISKEWFTWGDCYELDIESPEDEILALAVVLAIDCVIDAQRNN
ncbi:MAG: LURP-one-related family protein [Lachnospiraceae bacterium]|nr:LURP-one-related family protein [Lachnospiraceae bacterium]